MMVIVLGVVVFDVLEDGCVVFGVGGQYNFVVMVYVLFGVCSVLIFWVMCEDKGVLQLNVCWNYGYIIILCYLCDFYINEYGIVDLCNMIDEDCVIVMVGIIDVCFQVVLLDQVKVVKKLVVGFVVLLVWQCNFVMVVSVVLVLFCQFGLLLDYLLGSDFIEVEQYLVKVLGWLKQNMQMCVVKFCMVFVVIMQLVGDGDVVYLQCMGLEVLKDIGEWIEVWLVWLGLVCIVQVLFICLVCWEKCRRLGNVWFFVCSC